MAFNELGDFGATVGADFVESVDVDVDCTAVDQALQEFGVFDFVAVQLFLNCFDYAFVALGGG